MLVFRPEGSFKLKVQTIHDVKPVYAYINITVTRPVINITVTRPIIMAYTTPIPEEQSLC